VSTLFEKINENYRVLNSMSVRETPSSGVTSTIAPLNLSIMLMLCLHSKYINDKIVMIV
jgi:hypothetical protein